MHFLDWILKPFCRHDREIFRRRAERMGMECMKCFRWRPLDEDSAVRYSSRATSRNAKV
jgi:hypothetical protein